MQKITPFLWFDNNAEEAMQFYMSLFDNSEVKNIMRNGPGGPGPEGSVLTASFTLHGQEFAVLNGGPQNFSFNESVSFVINCDTQEEVDQYWNALTADGGEESMCGWLKDKYGLSWQVVPVGMFRLFQGDPQKSQRAMQAMMQMRKLDINLLQKAYDG
jgi:predicted 3-demethylubiquinone-9 3-methyltransferase (glyoxalase superfamily)